MIISKEKLERIKKIVENNYRSLLVSTVGSHVLSEKEIQSLKEAGHKVENKDSLLSLIYYSNILNDLTSTTGPLSISEMKAQQKEIPSGVLYRAAEEHLNENFAELVEKLKGSVQAGLEGIIRDYNFSHRNNTIQNLDRPEAITELVRQSSVGGLKKALREYSGDAHRDFKRIAVTEVANAIGIGSVDRIVAHNSEEDLNQVYVYRIPVNDSRLCKYCRKFYLDGDETPAVYRLSTILNNGTNYGKKPEDWLPVALANHPHDRESGVMQLRSGWKVIQGGRLEFIGQEAWRTYISEKLRD